MSTSEEECEEMSEAFEETGVIVAVCHVMRLLNESYITSLNSLGP